MFGNPKAIKNYITQENSKHNNLISLENLSRLHPDLIWIRGVRSEGKSFRENGGDFHPVFLSSTLLPLINVDDEN